MINRKDNIIIHNSTYTISTKNDKRNRDEKEKEKGGKGDMYIQEHDKLQDKIQNRELSRLHDKQLIVWIVDFSASRFKVLTALAFWTVAFRSPPAFCMGY